MDGFVLGLFLFAAFLGGFASGLAGFAMGFVVSGIWLHVITPIQTTALIAGYGLWTQGYGVWKLRQITELADRRAVHNRRRDRRSARSGAAHLSQSGSCAPRRWRAAGRLQHLRPRQAGVQAAPGRRRTTDGGVGFLNGVLGGLTGLPGFIITVWCQMRGWTKDEQRAVFQPVILAGMMMIAISLSVAGAITTDTLKLYVLGLPALLAGLWLGFKCYGKLDDATFRKVVLVLLLCSGLALIAAQGWLLTGLSLPSIASTLVSPALAGPVCRPVLAVTHATLSAMRPPGMERRWTATITADASKCVSKVGYFDLGILREKENSLPLEFREQFIWTEPSSLVGGSRSHSCCCC